MGLQFHIFVLLIPVVVSSTLISVFWLHFIMITDPRNHPSSRDKVSKVKNYWDTKKKQLGKKRSKAMPPSVLQAVARFMNKKKRLYLPPLLMPVQLIPFFQELSVDKKLNPELVPARAQRGPLIPMLLLRGRAQWSLLV